MLLIHHILSHSLKREMGGIMSETKKVKDNTKDKVHKNTASKRKTNYVIINHHPEHCEKNMRDIEKRLFEVFIKYKQ